MRRLIDVERLCEDLDKLYKQAEERRLKDLQKLLLDYITPITVGLTTVDAVERSEGKWIPTGEIGEYGDRWYKCSACFSRDLHRPAVNVCYCWNCGSRNRNLKIEKDDET